MRCTYNIAILLVTDAATKPSININMSFSKF